jgi:signal transduction histidine kinase
MNEDGALILFQTVRELLFNVVKHSGVKRATVEIRETAEAVRVVVRDAGRGMPFTPKAGPRDWAGGVGLDTARERLRMFGGDLAIESAPGAGTKVSLRWPRPA